MEPRRRVWRSVTKRAQSDSPEPSAKNTAWEVCRHHDVFLSKAPGYSQQVLDELLVSSENTSLLRRVAEAAQEDQWKPRSQQLKLEELQLKVELGVLSKSQVAEELAKFLELTQSRVRNLAYKSVYKWWEEVQERLAEEQQQEGSGSEEVEEVEEVEGEQ